jgi:hypothetical protein
MLEACSIVLALLAGILLVQIFDPARNLQPRWAAIVFDAALGAGAGIGLSSIVFLLLDVFSAASSAAIFGLQIVLAGILAWQWFQKRGRTRAPAPSQDTAPGFRWTWLLALAFGIALPASYVRLIQMASALPVGEWDAWALWNLRAKFLAGPSGAWRFALSPLLRNTHPDYPLLLSGFVAQLWKAGGAVDTFAPIATALIFFAALIALLIGAVALLRGSASALLAGLVILSTTSLLIWAPAQYADIPLALFYMGALALLFLETLPTAGGRWALPWAGVCAGFAAWTKNEGIAFLACITVVFFVLTLWRQRLNAALVRTGLLLAGAAPGILLTLWLKFSLAPAVDPLVTQGASGILRLLEFKRYSEVVGGFFTNLLNLGSGVSHPLILLAILAILLRWQIEERYQLPALTASVALVLVFLSYCAVFIITPSGVAWQVQTSFDRLILQVWPSFLLVFFVLLRSVADAAPPAVPIPSAMKRKSTVRSDKQLPRQPQSQPRPVGKEVK